MTIAPYNSENKVWKQERYDPRISEEIEKAKQEQQLREEAEQRRGSGSGA